MKRGHFCFGQKGHFCFALTVVAATAISNTAPIRLLVNDFET